MPDQDRTKKILLIVIIVVVLALIGYVLYRLILSRTSGPTPLETQQPPVGGSTTGGRITPPFPFPEATPLPSPTIGLEEQIKEQMLMALTDFSVISPTINKNQDRALFYKKDGGTQYAADFTGTLEKRSNTTIIGITETLWSPTKDRAIVFYLDGETLKSFLHIGTSTVISLPRDIKSASWSPDGKEFAYLITNENGLSLMIADSSAKNSKEVLKTPILDAQIQWITSSVIAFQTAPSGYANGFVFLYSRSNGSFQKIIGPLYGLTTLWSPDGSRVLVGFTTGSGKQLKLSLYASSGKEEEILSNITLPEKCVWQGSVEFYCAVPHQIPSSAVMPDEYLRSEFLTQDYILSYNTQTHDFKKVLEGGSMDMMNLGVTKNNDYLIFVNKTDGILWRLKLKN
ncbi:MAG: hypothetical protein U1A25_02580 [Candidatus Sungbacteria bacterium]|nr:hypothetical protein [bacterium]MDZ4260527.1 hypothetical protein [Candidatus Sungbacteria bacterium]